jgi:hypothetical protein
MTAAASDIAMSVPAGELAAARVRDYSAASSRRSPE